MDKNRACTLIMGLMVQRSIALVDFFQINLHLHFPSRRTIRRSRVARLFRALIPEYRLPATAFSVRSAIRRSRATRFFRALFLPKLEEPDLRLVLQGGEKLIFVLVQSITQSAGRHTHRKQHQRLKEASLPSGFVRQSSGQKDHGDETP